MHLLRLSLLAAAIGVLCAQAQDGPTHPAGDRPNVVIIYGDDVGWGDLGCYGATKIPTPNLDKLASQGLRFTDGHCSAATCTPSRFSMLTGVHGFRHGVRILRPDAPMTIKPDMLTLPELFKKAGYSTAVIGKWHLGIGDGKTKVDWKYIAGKNGKGELYHLIEDVDESDNLIAKHPDKATELQKLLEEKVRKGPGVRAALITN